MATPPTFVAFYATAFNDSVSPKTVSVTVAAGDDLVVIAGSEDSAQTLTTPTGGGLTYSLQQSVVVANWPTVYIWTAHCATSQTFTLTGTNTNGNLIGAFGYCAIRFSSTGGIGNSASTNVTSGAPSLALTTSGDNSAVISISDDWTALDGASRTWRTINGITPTAANGDEVAYGFDSGHYTAYGAVWPDAGVAGTVTLGLTAPGAQKYAIAGIEVKGIAGSSDPPGGYEPLSPVPPPLLFELVARSQAQWQNAPAPTTVNGTAALAGAGVLGDVSAVQQATASLSGAGALAARAGKVYYVSAVGSDSNDGLSTSTPWLTITKVNATTLLAGDVVQFRGGDTFTGQVAPGTSGTAASPIVYQSYGTGRATISNTTADAFAFVSHGGFEVRNLVITGGATSFSNGSAGVDAYSPTGSGKFAHIVVDGCDISGFQHGVIVGGDTTSEGFSDVTVNNCDCHGNKNDGVAIWGGAGGTAFSNSNVTITNVRAYSNLGDSVDTNPTGSGIVVGSTSTCLIDQCTAHDNGGSNNAAGGPVGIWCYDSTAVTIQRCLSYSNKTAGTTDGGGFDLDINVSSSTIQYCLAYSNDGPGYMCFASGTSVFTGNVVRYNVGWGNVRNTGLSPTTYGEMLVAGTVASTAIYGNSFYAKDNASNNISAFIINSTPSGVTVRNNIFESQAGATVQAGTAWAIAAALCQGNCYYRASGTQIKWGATTYTTLAAWRAAVANQEVVSAANTGFTVDPVFVSPTSTPTVTDATTMTTYTGLQLQTSSPLATAGQDMLGTFSVDPGTRDFWNDTLTVPLSVGAYEAAATVAGAATITGAGTLAAAAVQQATAAPTGAGTLTAPATLLGSASITGAGALAAPAVQQSAATLAGAGAVSAVVVQQATASLAGAGTLTANAAGTVSGTATITGAGALAVAATQGSGTSLTGAGALTATAVQQATASPAGAGAVAANVTQGATAAPAGAGAMSAPAVQQATATLTGAGALSATGTVPGGGGASLAGAGALSATATQGSGATLTGAGALSVAATQNGKATLTGAGVLSGAGVIAGTASLVGAGALSSPARQLAGASLVGAGVLSASAGGLTSGTAALVGVGVLTINLNPCVTGRPSTGTTTRPSTGTTAYALATTARPSTGITARPDTGTTTDPC